MEPAPLTLTSARLVLRPLDPRDTDAVHTAAQDPDVQRWTTIPSPYLYEHARSFIELLAPEGWATDSMFTFGVFLPDGPLTGVLSLTMRAPGTAEVGFWTAKEHRGHGYTTEATLTAARWAFTGLGIDRVEWRAEVGNEASRAVAENAGFTLEGTLRSAIDNRGVRRDCWLAALLPSDLGLPSTAPYLPARPPADPSES
ncbi:GNAT family N-acetyltransferase [Streptomyces scabiei]|uniref:GNAT family N-acetyltransferase n=1 Tax=Streptomyces scabiei TaxID=1930 RepID=UPI0029A087BE|nr:GNAT family N-acetyltransferase [Streptomyces scabiei]MDX3119048.1 GNAT family N-acetyltransferase [Streptomyces scabiei]